MSSVDQPSVFGISSAAETELTDEASISILSEPKLAIENMVHDDKLEILFELVGATDLIAEDDDIANPRPYCVVHFGDRKVHWSEPGQGFSPIWTIDTDSLFLLKTTPNELTKHSVTITLWTKRMAGLTEVKTFLGRLRLSAEDVIKHCDGQRFEMGVEDELGDDAGNRGYLALRLRLATEADSKFVGLWNSSFIREKNVLKAILDKEDNYPGMKLANLVTEKDEHKVAGANFMNALSSAFLVNTFYDARRGFKKKRVKPNPDPKRPKTTQFLSPHEIKIETRRPSENWVQAGSGKLGKLYVEILSCHDLPNVDVGEAVGNVTDSFVSLVFEDAFVQTPVIDDELSPHWLPWTQRAFCFGIMHPASQLYLGVFDFDLGPLVEHDPLGRVAVNISNLQRDTQYTLRYNLFKSANVTDRTPQGQITIRLRVEMFDEKAALLTALKPRPNIHVNVMKNKSFKCLRYTCFGEYDGEGKFDLNVTRSYVNEIFEYKRHLQYTIGDSLRSLMFWRGQVEVFSIFLPIHSLIFFSVASTLVERPYLLPSYLVLSVPWIIIANGRMRRQHPSPWVRVPTLFHYLDILIHGKSTQTFKRIDANEGHDAAVTYENKFIQREEDDYKKAEKRAEMELELNTVGNAAIHTEVKLGIPIDLLARLDRWQGYIGMVCRFFRKVKIVLLWEEGILSFWITAVFLAVGLVSLLLPWAFILRWTGRFVVYGVFGPQMKIVDLYLRANKADDLGKLMVQFDRKKKIARLRREQALKVKAVKCLRFGEYIIQVPAFNLSRHYDRPLPDSTARLIRKPMKVEFKSYLPGQQLFGDMLPRLEDGYLNNHSLALKRMESLSTLHSRLLMMQAAAKFEGGLARNRRLLKLKAPLAHDDDVPAEVGYELIDVAKRTLGELHLPTEAPNLPPPPPPPPPMVNIPPQSFSIPTLDGINLCVGPFESHESSLLCFEDAIDRFSESQFEDDVFIQDKYTDHNDSLMQSFECGESECTSEENYTEEEGVEVVAWGRFQASQLDESIQQEVEVISRANIGNLSMLYKESDHTFVAFYRP